MFFFPSLYSADHLLLCLSRTVVAQLSHCPPLRHARGAVNKQLRVKAAGRTDLGSSAHPAVNLVMVIWIIPWPNCVSCVKQTALQSNDTRNSSYHTMLSTPGTALALISNPFPLCVFDVFGSGVGGLNPSMFYGQQNWRSNLLRAELPLRLLAVTSKWRWEKEKKIKRLIVCYPIFSIRKIKRIAAFTGKSQGWIVAARPVLVCVEL